jgi:hypothetical protein
MNKLTNIFEIADHLGARRATRNVVRVSVPSDADCIAVTRRRPLVGAWTIDPVSGRLVGSWVKASHETRRSASRDARRHATSEIPIAA